MAKIESLTFKQLRVLGAIAECGSLSGAAQSLGLTAPAIHAQLTQLETNLGVRLVDRGGGAPARLTKAGEVVLRAQRTIDAVLGQTIERIDALAKGHEGVVTLGVVSTGKYFAPQLVARLKEAMPGIAVMLKVGNRGEIISMMQQGLIDLAIMGRPPREPKVVAERIGAHPHVLIAPPGHPLVGRGNIDPDEILAETFLAREPGSGTRILMMRYLDRIGGGMPYEVVEIGSNETIKQAVMAGLGIALISLHTVTEELKAGRLATISADGLPIIRQWYLLQRAHEPLSPAAQRVHDFIAGERGRFLPHV